VESIPPNAWAKLAVCVLIDALGDSSFLIPGLGELSDGLYAPLEAFLLGGAQGAWVDGCQGATFTHAEIRNGPTGQPT